MPNSNYIVNDAFFFLKERHRETFDEYIRSITPNYLECGIEYYFLNGSSKSSGWILKNCDILFDKIVYHFQNKQESNRGFCLDSSEPNLFSKIQRIDETVEYTENIVDAKKHFKIKIDNKNFGAWFSTGREHTSNRLSLRYRIYSPDKSNPRSALIRSSAGYGRNNHTSMCLELYDKNKYKDSFEGSNYNIQIAKYAIKNWMLYGQDFKFSEGEQIVYGAYSSDNFNRFDRYTCLGMTGIDELRVVNKKGQEIQTLKWRFYSMGDYRRMIIKKLLK